MLPVKWLDQNDNGFPDISQALTEPNGLLALGGDLKPERLLAAYARGIFPWYEEGQPILWWSPDPRMVLFPAELHISRSLRRARRKSTLRLSIDEAFPAVIRACAQTRRDTTGTWITGAMQEAYCQLHRLGHAHSVEAWQDDRLVGGLYGLAQGRVFFGESMFSLQDDASKIAFVHLVKLLESRGYELIDCQVSNQHLASLGARQIPRVRFQTLLPRHWQPPETTIPWPGPVKNRRIIRDI
ncbi:MAG: leucyl/phenylalanyl-tRNA--protein transferase [Pseudomonadales bacterium]|nr:leucyl/phenylalanyl-tRNA--protein transferase [Pseudomonadales bacterium]